MRIFISDLHLDEQFPQLTAGFHRFLAEHCQDIESLFILGDFFEVWLGDDHDTPFNREILAALNNLACKKYLMHGNRDFLIGQKFCDAAGAELLADPTVIDLPQGRTLLMHGDSLCTRDTEYMQARHQLRSPGFQSDFLDKPIEERDEIARQLRGKSQEHTREKAMDIMDVTPAEVEAVMKGNNVSLLVHGHTHRPAVHDLEINGQSAKRFVLGDWHSTMQYLEVTKNAIELKVFSVS